MMMERQLIAFVRPDTQLSSTLEFHFRAGKHRRRGARDMTGKVRAAVCLPLQREQRLEEEEEGECKHLNSSMNA